MNAVPNFATLLESFFYSTFDEAETCEPKHYQVLSRHVSLVSSIHSRTLWQTAITA